MPTIVGGVRCYRCKDKKKGCEAYSAVLRRPCQRCQDAGLAFEECVPDTNFRPASTTIPKATRATGRSFTDNCARFTAGPSRRGTTATNVSYSAIASTSGLSETQLLDNGSSAINDDANDTGGYRNLSPDPHTRRRLIDRPDPQDDTPGYGLSALNESITPERRHQSFPHSRTSKVSSPSINFAVSGADARCTTTRSNTASEPFRAVLNATENQHRQGDKHSSITAFNDEDVTSINPQLLLLNQDYDLLGYTYISAPELHSQNGYCDGCEQPLDDHAEFCPKLLLQEAKSLEFPQLLR